MHCTACCFRQGKDSKGRRLLPPAAEGFFLRCRALSTPHKSRRLRSGQAHCPHRRPLSTLHHLASINFAPLHACVAHFVRTELALGPDSLSAASSMQITVCSSRGAVQLTRVAAACARSISSNATASRGVLPRQVAAPAAQLGHSAFLGGHCAQLAGGARRVAGQQQQQQQARGFRSSTTTMGLKTGIVGLPNVGKVRPGSTAAAMPPAAPLPPAPPPESVAAGPCQPCPSPLLAPAVHHVQRAVRKRQGPGRQLPLLHHRAKRGHRRRARRPPGAAQVGAVQAVVGAVQAEPGWSEHGMTWLG